MYVGGGLGVVTQFRVGSEQNGFCYSLLPQNPRLYKCDRSTTPGEPANYRLYMFNTNGAWYAIEGPVECGDDNGSPTVQDLWAHGIFKWKCRHTAIREGKHHWLKCNAITKEEEPGTDVYLRTTVISFHPGPYPGLDDHELIDQNGPNSDTEDESKGKGKGKSRGGSSWGSSWGGGSSGGWGGKGGKY